MLLISEPSNDDGREIKLNSSLIKTITGNDSITARALYKNRITTKPTLNVLVLCNAIADTEKVERAMIDILSIITLMSTCVERRSFNKHPNNRLMDDDLNSKLNDDTGLEELWGLGAGKLTRSHCFTSPG